MVVVGRNNLLYRTGKVIIDGIGTSRVTILDGIITATGAVTGSTVGGVAVGNGTATGATQLSGTGVPAAGLGANGDFYFRSDGTVAAHTVIYHKEAGAWVATAA